MERGARLRVMALNSSFWPATARREELCQNPTECRRQPAEPGQGHVRSLAEGPRHRVGAEIRNGSVFTRPGRDLDTEPSSQVFPAGLQAGCAIATGYAGF